MSRQVTLFLDRRSPFIFTALHFANIASTLASFEFDKVSLFCYIVHLHTRQGAEKGTHRTRTKERGPLSRLSPSEKQNHFEAPFSLAISGDRSNLTPPSWDSGVRPLRIYPARPPRPAPRYPASTSILTPGASSVSLSALDGFDCFAYYAIARHMNHSVYS